MKRARDELEGSPQNKKAAKVDSDLTIFDTDLVDFGFDDSD